MGFKMKYNIEQRFLTSGTKRRPGLDIRKVRFMVAHDTGNPGSTASGNVNYYQNSRNEMSASAQLFVDDERIIECIPFLTASPEKAWHVLYNVTTDNNMFGCDANDAAGGVELCYGGKINMAEAYKRYIWVLAYSCYKYGLNPATMITGHYILDPARKTDPKGALALMGKDFNQLIRDVVAEYNNCVNGGAEVSVEVPSKPQEGGSGKGSGAIGVVTITASAVNLRDGASMSANVIGSLPKGSPWEVFYQVGDWYCVGANQFCTANPEFVQYKPNGGGSTNSGSSSSYATGTVTADSLRVRSGAGTNYDVIGGLTNGQKVGITGESNGWYKINFNGETGYVSAEYVSKNSTSGNRDTLRRGDQGDDVLQMQKDLCKAYFYPDKAAADKGCIGIFGPKTEDAVRRFQSVHMSSVDGVFGPNTRAALYKVIGK